MWLITPLGFFSIVQKPADMAAGTLTIRARVRTDLAGLKAALLPDMGAITQSASTDYRFRATAPRAKVQAALGALVAGLDYANFKSEVARVQGAKRAKLYSEVWAVLHRLQGDAGYEWARKRPTKPKAAKVFEVPKAKAYGGVLFDELGRTLLREPKNHFDGYLWTFPKGQPDAGETPEQAALREVREETGYTCQIVGALAGVFKSSPASTTAFFLMRPVGEPAEPHWETARTGWFDANEAQQRIGMSTNALGRARDLAVLEAALAALPMLAP